MIGAGGSVEVLLTAVALDLLAGDPPNRFHPVAAMGWWIAAGRKGAPSRGRVRPLLAGAAIVASGMGLAAALGAGIAAVRGGWPVIGFAAEVVLLKSLFSVRGLGGAALAVRRALAAGDLPNARRLLSWHLVSRDTANLSETQVAAAAVESVAENASDSVIAPWFYYLIGGLPAAAAYRFANTADAMLGYRDAEREWLGKVPARADDVLNWVPARLTAGLLVLAAPLVGGSTARGVRVWWRDGGRTASPNAGRPMAAAAGVLGVELEKVGHYRLGAGLPLPGAADVGRAVRLMLAAVAVFLTMSGLVATGVDR